jgi:hypothetical protein
MNHLRVLGARRVTRSKFHDNVSLLMTEGGRHNKGLYQRQEGRTRKTVSLLMTGRKN